jgi:hypothetical protein
MQEERDMETRSSRITIALTFVNLVAVCMTWLKPEAAKAQETSKEVIADQIRSQGFTCDTPESAKRDPERSKPDEAVWILKCEKKTYRVRLIPDMAADVVPLD